MKININYSKVVLLFYILCFGCNKTDIENDLRILVKGKVVNQGLAIGSAEISVNTDSGGYGANMVKLGGGTSNPDGTFEFVSLYGQNEFFEIEVSYQDNYSSYLYLTNSENYYPQDLTIDIGTIELREIANFNYNFTRTSPQGTTLEYTMFYTNPNCVEYFENNVLNPVQSSCYEQFTFSRTLNDINSEVNQSLSVPLGSNIEFSYSIAGGALITEIITVNQSNFDYDFSY